MGFRVYRVLGIGVRVCGVLGTIFLSLLGLGFRLDIAPRVQVPNTNSHILSKILTYRTTILKPSTQLLGPFGTLGERDF